jgi:A/G-specific adenine glycosylase
LNDASGNRALTAALLDWYADHQRILPWRQSDDPYAVWVSEIMLQQTRVATVIPYFERWMERFPDVTTLAAANEDEVLHCWQGLGYYSRARGLLQGARMVIGRFDGRVPADVGDLCLLPGVGPYTAGAIASIAFGKDEPVVDGNVIRVLTRLFALPGDPTKAPLKRELWELARALLPAGRAAEFNQAVMELGALCCTPRSPLCGECPVRGSCLGFRQGEATRFPELAKRVKVTRIVHVAALVRNGDRILVTQVPLNASLWAGLWRLPTVELSAAETEEAASVRAVAEATGLTGVDAGPVADLVHHVTRYRVHLKLRTVKTSAEPPTDRSNQWLRPANLDELAMPAPHRKLVAGLIGGAPDQ